VAANKSAVIDVLVQFPDESAAEAIGLQLKDPGQREKASQALLVLGPIASDTVSHYINHPDEGVRKEAQRLSRELKVTTDHQLEQILADIGDAHKARSRTALEHLAHLRVDETSRATVSKALNAPLGDPDAGIRDAALDAVRIWGTQENTTALVKLLGTVPAERREKDAHTNDKVVQALISLGSGAEDAVAPLLRSPDGLVRRQACFILGEIGTQKSVAPLSDAATYYVSVDRDFYLQTQQAITKVMARK
jgi:HEAT repeat protein